VEPHASADVSSFIQARLDIICGGNREVLDYYLNLEALCVQRPGDRLGVAVVLVGGQGCGKTFLVSQLMDFFGPHARRFSHQNTLTNHFNAWLRNTLMLFVDEAHWRGDCSGLGAIKLYITDEKIELEAKGKDSISITNYIKLFFATNDRYAIAADKDDRRLAVFICSDLHRCDRDYFAWLKHQWDDQEGKEAYLDFLLSRDLNGFNPLARPTALIATLFWSHKKPNMSAFEGWWFESLRAGEFACLNQTGWPSHVNLSKLYDSYSDYFDRSRKAYDRILSPRDLWDAVKGTLLPQHTGSLPDAVGGVYCLPDLHSCREHFAREVVFTPATVLFAE